MSISESYGKELSRQLGTLRQVEHRSARVRHLTSRVANILKADAEVRSFCRSRDCKVWENSHSAHGPVIGRVAVVSPYRPAFFWMPARQAVQYGPTVSVIAEPTDGRFFTVLDWTEGHYNFPYPPDVREGKLSRSIDDDGDLLALVPMFKAALGISAARHDATGGGT